MTHPWLAHPAEALTHIGREFHARGWVFGTSGNFSAVINHDPLRLLMTPSGADKGALAPADLVVVDASGNVISGPGKASAEAGLHAAVVHATGAGSVLHTHSVPVTVLSGLHAPAAGLHIEGYEMLKGLEGIRTHEYREWVPIFANSQDIPTLSAVVEEYLRHHPNTHGFLLEKHGLYTWGASLAEARRHVEIFEFLFDVLLRTHQTQHR